MNLADGPTRPAEERDRGSVMPMATILVIFLMIGCVVAGLRVAAVGRPA